MLSLKNIVVHYGGVQALKGISLHADEGAITCLIGANGAGKSTTLRAISGLAPLTSGEIWFRNQRIDGFDPEEIVELGISHVPEGKKLFLEMTVRDNLLSGAYLRKDKKEIEDDMKRVCHYFPILERANARPAAQMSGGEQQMLAIARGLMNSPKMLLLDEPSLGLSPLLTREVAAIIKRISEEGMTILLIEQNASLALRLANQCYVLETGSMVLEGQSKDLQSNPHIKSAYLGIDPEMESPSSISAVSYDHSASPHAKKKEITYDEPERTFSKSNSTSLLPEEATPILLDSWERYESSFQSDQTRSGIFDRQDDNRTTRPAADEKKTRTPAYEWKKSEPSGTDAKIIKRVFNPSRKG